MFIEWVLLGKVLKLYLVHKSKNRDFHNTSLQNALTRNLGQRLNTHLVSQGHIRSKYERHAHCRPLRMRYRLGLQRSKQSAVNYKRTTCPNVTYDASFDSACRADTLHSNFNSDKQLFTVAKWR